MKKFAKAAGGLLVFLLFVSASYIVYIKTMKVDVVFYASLAAAGIALLAFAVPLYVGRFFRDFSSLERAQLLVICALTGYVLAISVPTVLDRSLSFYILEKLQQRGGAIKLSKFPYIFTQEYMREHRLVDVRITEQVESGTIRIDGDCVRLTPRGDRLATFSRKFRHDFLPKRRLLRGEYTDQLTDPFARSDAAPDYLCDRP